MCKNEKRTHGTAARSPPVAEMIASEARHARARGHAGARPQRVQRPLSMPFPGRSIERVLRDLATPSNHWELRKDHAKLEQDLIALYVLIDASFVSLEKV